MMTNVPDRISMFSQPFNAAEAVAKYTKKPKYIVEDDPRPAFMDEVRSHGFQDVPALPTIGKLERITAPDEKRGKKSGWYIYNEVPDDRTDNFIGIGVFGSWKGNPERVVWTSKRRETMTASEQMQFEERLRAEKLARDEALAQKQAESAIKARVIWDESVTAPESHPYLEKKQIKPHGVRVSRGSIVVPVQIKGQITSLQFIDVGGGKLFLSGGRVKGGYYKIEGHKDTVYVAEGFATAATLHEISGATVYAAFNAGNLAEVAGTARDEHPDAELIIAGDDDHKTDGNPGRTKATTAADIMRCKTIFPEVSGDDTDFNDMYCTLGADAVKNQLKVFSGAFSNVGVSSFTEILYDTTTLPQSLVGSGMLSPSEFMLIAGPPKAQKTLLASYLAVCAGLGKPFLSFEIPKPLRVFYVNAEVNARIMRKRIKESAAPLTGEEEQILGKNLKITDRFREILDHPGVKGLAELAKRAFPDGLPELIIIDPMANVFDGETENDNVAMRRFLNERIEQLREQINPHAAVILVHHAGKSSPDRLREDPFDCIRGSSALRGHYDSAIVIYRPKIDSSNRRVAFELRGGEAPDPFDIEYREGSFTKVSSESQRLTRINLGAMEDAERLRRKHVLLGIIWDEAGEGNLVTTNSIAAKYEGKQGLGGSSSIERRLKVLQSQGWIRFTKDYSKLKVDTPKSRLGYLVVPNMVLKKPSDTDGKSETLPVDATHYRDNQTDAVIEVPNDLPWPKDDADEK